ncbi:DUF4783 domain-containing protein [Algoriphagus kandeliae]|uniref:DUF4783 domain-containing protein n=1 Tax=Algoriphagus kandeliae TaxID=2562278 RepID=A0A4Y9QT14_9BACT|nr:DUF4783 domain-containing protein [Algoriphagus kandeliae]TFV95569.1 DUF4783 domain-containing protein [Algoriphagus kandeliae]
MTGFKLFLFFLTFLVSPVEATKNVDSIDPVILAIDSGSSSELARYFGNSISLNINGQQGDFSKNQAELVLRDFFKKNPPVSFQVVFRSENNPSLSSYIGEYQSGQTSYKVFIKINQQNSQIEVYSLGFVKA